MRPVRRTAQNRANTQSGLSDEVSVLFRQYLRLKEQVKRLDELKARLLDIAATHGVEDDKGHRSVELPTPLTVGSRTAEGFVRRRREQVILDEDKVRQLLEAKGLADRVIRQEVIEVIDQDELWACQQEDLITEEELDECFTSRTTYALEIL